MMLFAHSCELSVSHCMYPSFVMLDLIIEHRSSKDEK